jgi:hypothetical protein
MFGKSSNQKRVKQAIPEFAEVMMLWNMDRKTALAWGEKFANQALANTEANLSRMDEDVNLAELYLSGQEPTTPYGIIFMKIIDKYSKQRDSDDVTDDDMLWYWSMPMLEREFIHEMTNAYRTGLSMLIMQSRDWSSEEEMWAKVQLEVSRNTVAYGLIEPADVNVKDKTRALPFELYRRVENYRQFPFSPEDKARLVKLDNQNAFIREQLKKGAL